MPHRATTPSDSAPPGRAPRSDRRGPRRKAPRGTTRAFTLLELLVVLAILAVVAGLLLGFVTRARSAARGVECVSNLRQVGHALLDYATANGTKLPDPHADGISWENTIVVYLNDDSRVFRCPADEELYPAIGSSYDWRDTGNPLTTLAGQSVEGVNRSDAVLAFESLPGWHEKKVMNAVRLDGSAGPADQTECLEDLQKPLRGEGTARK